MASKSEVESENLSLKLKIKELESKISEHPPVNVQGSDSTDATAAALLKELQESNKERDLMKEEIKRLSAERDSLSDQCADLGDRLKKASEKSAAANKSDAHTAVLSAKEISYHYHRRELDDDTLFTRV